MLPPNDTTVVRVVIAAVEAHLKHTEQSKKSKPAK
jgi:hypothetical protein